MYVQSLGSGQGKFSDLIAGQGSIQAIVGECALPCVGRGGNDCVDTQAIG